MVRHSRRVLAAILLAPLLWLQGCDELPGPGGVAFHDAWVRPVPPGQSMTAAYGRIENRDARARTIMGWTSDTFDRVSVHQTDVRNGVSSMRELAAIGLLPLESMPLEPGGMHLMLMGARRELRVGDSIKLTATDDSGTQWEFTVPVEAR
jgi:hypothetical protein